MSVWSVTHVSPPLAHAIKEEIHNLIFCYPCPPYPIRTENSVKRRSCLLMNTQRTGSSCLPAMAEQGKLQVPALLRTAILHSRSQQHSNIKKKMANKLCW